MSINTTFFRFFKMAAVRHLRFLKSSKYQLLVWRPVHYYVRTTQKFPSYASSAIFRVCYSLSVRKNCLTYVQPTMIVFYL